MAEPMPAFGLGLAPLGKDAGAPWRETVDAAWDAGVRFFDTAPLYGPSRRAEQRLGAALHGRARGSFAVATKSGWTMLDDGARVADFSYDATLRSVAESLRLLGVDRLDVLHVHDPAEHHDAALAGAYRAAVRLREEGVVGHIGAGFNDGPAAARFVAAADLDCVLIALRYTLLDQSALASLLPLCDEREVAVIAAGVFGSGLLADPADGAPYAYAPAPPELVGRARRLAAVCARYGVPLAAAALRFPFGHPAVRSVVVGAGTPAEIADDVRLAGLDVPRELWAELVSEGLLPEEVPTP
ncbi:aldo/keto reductase [Jiangella anatolica]|nr:aldo/keto reductase [Jiangella anatolica]